MDALLVGAVTALGAVTGAVLDPIGQRAAEASRRADEARRAARHRRRAEADAGVGGAPAPPDGPQPVPELGPAEPALLDPATEPGPRPLLPLGRSPGRTAGAAAVTAACWALAGVHFGRHLLLLAYLVLLAFLVVVSVTDLTHRLVPRRLLYGALALLVAVLVAVSVAGHTWHDLAAGAVAGAVAFGVFFVVWFAVPRGMGYGDVRLAGVIGVATGYLSFLHAYVAFLVGFVVGVVLGLVLAAGSPDGRRTRLPFAPALAVGAAVSVLAGGPIAHALFPTVA